VVKLSIYYTPLYQILTLPQSGVKPSCLSGFFIYFKSPLIAKCSRDHIVSMRIKGMTTQGRSYVVVPT